MQNNQERDIEVQPVKEKPQWQRPVTVALEIVETQSCVGNSGNEHVYFSS